MSQKTDDSPSSSQVSLRDPLLAAVYVQKLVNGIPAGIALAGIVLILFATTFPFSIQFPPGTIAHIVANGFETNPFRHDHAGLLEDFLLNIVLFMPMGFGVAGMLRRAGRSITVVLIWTCLVGLLLTCIVEGVQLGMAETRDSSLSDIISNSMGALVGGICWMLPANKLMDWCPTLISNHTGRPDVNRLMLVLLAWCLGLIGLAGYLHDANGLGDWMQNVKLGVGNEFIDVRAWRGNVMSFSIADDAIDAQAARQLINGASPRDVMGNHLQAWYVPGPAGHVGRDGENASDQYPAEIVDQTGKQPNLKWMSTPYDLATPQVREHWLASAMPVHVLNSSLAFSNQLTLYATFSTTDPAQIGDQRIITLSADAFNRNLSLMQEKNDLAIRLRTGFSGENGQKPVLIIPNVFPEGGKVVQLVFTYADGVSSAYLSDRPESYTISTHPEGVMLWQLFPRSGWNLSMDQSPMRAHLIIFNLIAFAPIGILGGAIATLLRSRYRLRWLLGVAIIPALLLHLTFALASWGGVRPVAIATSLAVTICSLLISYIYLTIWLRYAAAQAAER